jgi:hypothetical protein
MTQPIAKPKSMAPCFSLRFEFRDAADHPGAMLSPSAGTQDKLSRASAFPPSYEKADSSAAPQNDILTQFLEERT